jgi:hypothetical protein
VKADLRKRRRYLGGIVPFGWRVTEDRGLAEDPDQQRAIRRIFDLRRDGLSLRAMTNSTDQPQPRRPRPMIAGRDVGIHSVLLVETSAARIVR